MLEQLSALLRSADGDQPMQQQPHTIAPDVLASQHAPGTAVHDAFGALRVDDRANLSEAVSYTHLTLPTICSV